MSNINKFEDYKRYVDKYNRLPGGFGGTLKKILSERQLEKKFNAYVKRNKLKDEKAATKIAPFSSKDTLWQETKREVRKIDNDSCQLLESLKILAKSDDDYERIYKEALKQEGLLNELDPAHVIPRSSSKALKYDPENVVLLKRVFHSRIDFGRNPITGKLCSKEDISLWWDIILTARSLKLNKMIDINYLKNKDTELRKRRNYG